MNTPNLNLPHWYYAITKMSESEGPREIKESVCTPGIVTLTYAGAPHAHILPLAPYSLQLVRAKPIDLNKSPKEISDLLNAQGFKRISMTNPQAVKDIYLDKFASGEWKGYASFEWVPFGILFPIKYDFSKLKGR